MKYIKRILVVLISFFLFGCKVIVEENCPEVEECETITLGQDKIVSIELDSIYKLDNIYQDYSATVSGSIEYNKDTLEVKGIENGVGVIKLTKDNNIDRFTFYVFSADKVELRIIGDRIMHVGEELTLSSNLPNAIFSSSDSSIISVTSDGLVKANKAGKVTITATLENETDEVTFTVYDEEKTEFTLLGIDQIEDYLSLFEGKRVGLITNQSGVNSSYISSIDILYKYTNLVSLFSPEHGIRGNVNEGATVGDTVDAKTGVKINSLYGNTLSPTKEMLDEIDVMCFDIQDVGARFYTYIYTMSNAMIECQKYNKKFVVFDRPNPIGDVVEGNILNMDYSSFIGKFPLVQRHGMTVGELALMFNQEFGIGCDLEVVKMKNYNRNLYLDETSMPWVNPSPNIPQIETAVVYPGTCVFEGTNLSVARGTTKPFQWIGAPYIDGIAWADALNELGLPGVYFRPVWFTPLSSTNANQLCSGVEVHVTDRSTFESVYTGWAMFYVIRHMYPSNFKMTTSTINVNTGCNYFSKDLYNLEELRTIIQSDSNTFKQTRSKYLLY